MKRSEMLHALFAPFLIMAFLGCRDIHQNPEHFRRNFELSFEEVFHSKPRRIVPLDFNLDFNKYVFTVENEKGRTLRDYDLLLKSTGWATSQTGGILTARSGSKYLKLATSSTQLLVAVQTSLHDKNVVLDKEFNQYAATLLAPKASR